MELAARIGAWSGKALPYDAEVEYIESSGAQWIDTRLKCKPEYESEVKLSLTGFNGDDCLLGSKGVGNTRTILVGFYDNGWSSKNSVSVSAGDSNHIVVVNNEVEIGVVKTYKSIIHTDERTLYKNGSFLGTNTDEIPFYSDDITMILFARHWGSQDVSNFCLARLYFAKIFSYENLLIDFVPVRFTNENGVSEGAMYDRVSGQLFRNQGAGAFIIGPDKT